MRLEEISYSELFEILGLEDKQIGADKLYGLGARYENLGHEEVLSALVRDYKSF